MARVTIPGVAHHVTQRGNNRQAVFLTDDDRRLYLKLLGEEARRHGVSILAYCLMDAHIHLIVVPERTDSLARGLGRAHFRYAQTFNRHHRRSGHLWQNRFFSCPLEGDHFWHALRYVERNPVRARLTRRAWTYPWSSATAHIGRRVTEIDSGVLDLAAWAELSLGRDWQAELTRREAQEEVERLRRHSQTGRPLMSETYLKVLERQMGRRLRALPVGRPAKTGK
jgi:putative transposase